MNIKKVLCLIPFFFVCLFLSVGYAVISKGIKLIGTIDSVPPTPEYDVFISNVDKVSGSNVFIQSYTSTILFTSVSNNGSTTFSVTVKNISEKDYVYMGVIEGKDVGVDGVYVGNDITYTVVGLNQLQQLDKINGELTFTVIITAKNNVITDNFLLKFNFVEKTGSEILPGGDSEDETPVELAVPVVTINELGIASWITVANATGYKYKINGGSELNTTKLSIQLSPNDYIEVKSVGDGTKYLDSEYCLPVKYSIVVEPEPEPELIKLSTPNVTIDNTTGVASWAAINNAVSYAYVIDNGAPISTNSLSVKLIYNQSIKVMAIGDGINYSNSDYSTPKKLSKPVFDSDFLGLSQVLLSNQSDCLNSSSDIIYGGVRGSIGNAPNGQTPALHCEVTSISGGTMSKITLQANQNLTQEVQYIIEPDLENPNKMYLYMYYKTDCTEQKKGTYILVYKQIIVRDTENSDWYEDGTYIGKAMVGNYYGGGKNGKSILTIGIKTWSYGAPEEN